MSYSETPRKEELMFNLKLSKTKNENLDEEIKRLHETLSKMHPGSDGYATVADNLSKLYKLKEPNSSKKLSKDALLSAGASLAGILIIVGYEHAHAVTSKALGFVPKTK